MSYRILVGSADSLIGWLGAYDVHADHTHNLLAPDGWYIKSRCIDEFHIVMLRSGRAVYRVEDTSIDMKAGSVVVIGPLVEHGVQADREHWPSLCTARFDLYSRADGTRRNFPLAKLALHIESNDFPRRLRVFDRLHRYRVGGASELNRLLAANALEGLLLDLLNETYCGPEDFSRNNIQAVIEYMQQYPGSRASIRQLAGMAGLSVKHFHIHFLRHTGMSPNRYQIYLRCESAKMLLGETGRSIKEIAFYLGYPDPFSFSKQFRKFVGMSPSEYMAFCGNNP